MDDLNKRVRKVLDDLANGIFNADDIGNLIRDLVHELRQKRDHKEGT